jgi:hypothetical protein
VRFHRESRRSIGSRPGRPLDVFAPSLPGLHDAPAFSLSKPPAVDFDRSGPAFARVRWHSEEGPQMHNLFVRSSRNSTISRPNLRRRRLGFEELENRNMLAASPIGLPVTTAVPASSAVGSTVVGAAVVLTPSVLSPVTAAPLISIASALSSPTIGATNSTQLPEILALGENSLAATELPDDTLSLMPTAWTPSSGFVTPLSQAVGGMVTRTESLEHGELGMLHPMSRSSHGVVRGADEQNQPPAGSNDPLNIDDSYDDMGRGRPAIGAVQIADAATAKVAVHSDGCDSKTAIPQPTKADRRI